MLILTSISLSDIGIAGHALSEIAVSGHAGKLIFGTIGEQQVPVMLLVGRAQSVATILDRKDLHKSKGSFFFQFL